MFNGNGALNIWNPVNLGLHIDCKFTLSFSSIKTACEPKYYRETEILAEGLCKRLITLANHYQNYMIT